MVVGVRMGDEGLSAPWFTINDFAKKLSHPFISPGGPVAVVGAAASKRQRVADFQQQATEALASLAAEVQQALAEQAATTGIPLSFNSIHAADLSVPLASGPACTAPAAAAAAGAALWLAPLLPNNPPTIPDVVRNLESWREGSAAGVAAVRSGRVQPPPTVTAAGTGVPDDMLQPGSDTVITVVIFEAGSEQTKVVLQEIQVLGSNTLADLRDSITCPLDRLAEGLGTSNPASYFFIDDTFYDDTRQASNTECSALLQQWAAAAGILKPRALVHACKEVEDLEQQWQQQQQHGVQQGSIPLQQVVVQQQQLQQQLDGAQQQQQHSDLQVRPRQQQQHSDLQTPPPPPQQQQHPDLQAYPQQQQRQQQHPDLQAYPQQQQRQQQHPDLQAYPQQEQQQQQQHPDLQVHPQQQQQHPNLQVSPQQQQQQHSDLQSHHTQQLQQHPDLQPDDPQQQQQDRATGDGPPAMQHTRLLDLHLQVSNRPLCLYSHQGFCEHQMMIADVRLLHRDDPQTKSAYPRTTFKVPVGKRLQCNICKSRKGASILLVNHPETPEQVSMLCNSCAGLFDTTAYPNSKRVELE